MKAKKSLGQNFLRSPVILKKIVEAGELQAGEVVLEIGPGKGALTEKLLDAGAKVVAVEKDNELYSALELALEQEVKSGNLTLQEHDILEFDPVTLDQPYKVIANIPYNITGAIIKKFLTVEHQPKLMVLMVQHEVAQRILARDGKESLLSIGVKAYGEPKLVTKVSKKYFSPQPKVDSAVILIRNISRTMFRENKIDEKVFWKIVKAGFAHKRKKLLKNLKNIDENTNWKEVFMQANVETKIRAEDLSLGQWIALTKHLKSTPRS